MELSSRRCVLLRHEPVEQLRPEKFVGRTVRPPLRRPQPPAPHACRSSRATTRPLPKRIAATSGVRLAVHHRLHEHLRVRGRRRRPRCTSAAAETSFTCANTGPNTGWCNPVSVISTAKLPSLERRRCRAPAAGRRAASAPIPPSANECRPAEHHQPAAVVHEIPQRAPRFRRQRVRREVAQDDHGVARQPARRQVELPGLRRPGRPG